MSRIRMGLRTESNLETRDSQEDSENERHPRDLHQHRSEGDEEGAKDDGSQNAVEEDLMTVLRRDCEEVEDHKEDEEIVD